jgi:glyoxylase I family protein
MFRILEIDHVVIRARDAARLVHFYCDALGCSVERRQDAIGLVQLRAGRSLIDIVGVDGPLGRKGGAAPGAQAHNMDHLCVRVEPFDVDAMRAHLETHGARIGEFGWRYGADGEGPSLYIEDPEGNTVELKGPPSPRPAQQQGMPLSS